MLHTLITQFINSSTDIFLPEDSVQKDKLTKKILALVKSYMKG